jgi:hypothetical protein
MIKGAPRGVGKVSGYRNYSIRSSPRRRPEASAKYRALSPAQVFPNSPLRAGIGIEAYACTVRGGCGLQGLRNV